MQLQAQIDALSAARAAALVEFDAAFRAAYPPSAEAFRERAARAELACALRTPERAVERLSGEARMLVAELPATHAALGEGRFSYRHAQLLIDETAGLSPAERGAVERLALGVAGSTTAAQFTRRVQRLRERRDPSTMVERARTAMSERCLTLDPVRDGMAYLTLYTGAVEASAILERADAAAARALADGDPRTLVQLRADLVVDALLDRDTALGLSCSQLEAMATGTGEFAAAQEAEFGTFAGIVPTVIVTVPVQTLLGGDAPGTLEGAGPIDAATARQLIAQAPGLYRLLVDAERGTPLSLSRSSYRVPESLRRWLRIRDGSCRFPRCGIGTRRCDIDHTLDWTSRAGPTDHDNLAHLSRGHHTLKHHGGWRVRQPRPGHLMCSYLGREYATEPAVA